MYTLEFIENWVQLYNIITVYLCMLPLGWSMLFSCVLICESLCRANIMGRKYGIQNNRNITVSEKIFNSVWIYALICFFFDTHCSYIYWYDLWPSIGRLRGSASSTFSLFSKLRRMLQESTHQYAEDVDEKLTSFHSKSRRRRAIGRTFSDKIAKRQNKSFPYRAKMLVVLVFASLR